MRTFEIVLLAVNALALGLNFKAWSKALWLGVAAINVAALLIHAVFEGLRYQMAFAYGFSFLLIVLVARFVLTRAGSRLSQVRIPKALKIVASGFALVLLALTAFLAYALPVFTLPKPTGPYAVGVRYFDLVDPDRADPFLNTSTHKRELMVKLYYPAQQDDAKPFAAYVNNSFRLTHAFADFYHVPEFVFDHLRLVRINAKNDLVPSDAQASYPVILFSHGAGASMEFETSQSEDLASHGYVVVDIDHTYVSAATDFPDRVVTAQEATTNFDTPEPAEPITQIMADDNAFVIKKLREMNEGSPDHAFKGRLNLNAIGVMGHSVGGAVAYNMAVNNSSVKAAINLDGVVYITPKDPQNIAPFLMLANDQYHIQAIEQREPLMQKFDSTPESQQMLRDLYGSPEKYAEAYNTARQNISGLADVLKRSGTAYTIEGSDHMKFTDMGLFIDSRWLRDLVQIRGNTDPARCLEITQALTVAFFDHHLKGQTTDSTDLMDSLAVVVQKYPELKKVNLN